MQSSKAAKISVLASRYVSTLLNFVILSFLSSVGEYELAALIAVTYSFLEICAFTDFGNRNILISNPEANVSLNPQVILSVIASGGLLFFTDINPFAVIGFFLTYICLYPMILEGQRALHKKKYAIVAVPTIVSSLLLFPFFFNAEIREEYADILVITWTLLPLAAPGAWVWLTIGIGGISFTAKKSEFNTRLASSGLYVSSYFAISYCYLWLENPKELTALAILLRVLNLSMVGAMWIQTFAVDYYHAGIKDRIRSSKFWLYLFAQIVLTNLALFIAIELFFESLSELLLDRVIIIAVIGYVSSRVFLSLINSNLLARGHTVRFFAIESIACVIVMSLRAIVPVSLQWAILSIILFQILFLIIYYFASRRGLCGA